MTRAPWSRTKAARSVLSPDEEWAADIRARILHDAHPWQAQAIEDPARRISLLVGRGGAKTTTMRARAIIKITSLRNQYVGYAATSADQARDLNWNKLKSACEAYEIRSEVTSTVSKAPDVSFLDTKMILTCNRTGSIYRLRGVEDKRDAEKFRGFPQAEFQVDECGSFPPELLEYLVDQSVAPRLGEALALDGGRGGCIVLGSTPPPTLRGMFYEVTRDGSKRHRRYADRDKQKPDGTPEHPNWKGYSSHAWTLKDVYELEGARDLYPALVANWEEALVQKEEKGWGDDHPIWQREYLGQWSADNTSTVFQYRPHLTGEAAKAAGVAEGSEWNQWAPHGERYVEGLEGLKLALKALPTREDGTAYTWHFVVACDDGTRDPFACNVFAFAPADQARRMFHVYAFEATGMYSKSIAELLLGAELDHNKPAGVLGVIGWPDAMSIDADPNLILDQANTYGLRFRKFEKKPEYKHGAIELTNGDLVEGRIKIIKGSPLDKQIRVLQWKIDEHGNPREDKAQANHSTDTLIIARKDMAYLFESGNVTADARPTDGTFKDPMGLDDEIGSQDEGEFSSLLSEPEWGILLSR